MKWQPLFFRLMRWGVPLCAGVLIVYYALNMPVSTHGIGIQRHAPTGPTVLGVTPGTATTFFHPGEVLLAINHWPTAQDVDWRWFFPVEQTTHQFAVWRDNQVVEISLPMRLLPTTIFYSQLTPFVLAFFTWVIGALVLFFAPLENRAAWQVGTVTTGFAVGLAALVANANFIPGGRTGSEALLPLMGAGFVEMAFYPRAALPARSEHGFLKAVYGVALVLTLSALGEIFVLAPLGWSMAYSSYAGLRLWIGACLLANPIIIGMRYFRAPRSPVKQQLRILLVCTVLAVWPVLVLTIVPPLVMPVAKLYAAFPIWEIPLACLVLIPSAYAYIIYRHKFLGLDVFFTRTLAVLLLGFLLLMGYGLFYAFLQQSPSLLSLEPLPSAMFILVAFIGTPAANAKTRQAAQLLLYGQREAAERVWANLAAALTRSPELATLRHAVQEVADLLEVRQAALWLPDVHGTYQVVTAWRVEPLAPIAAPQVLYQLPAALVTRTSAESGELQSAAPVNTPQPLLGQYPWIEVLLPLQVGSETVGLLALGPRVPDGPLNAFQLGFVKRAGSLLAMAAHTTRLFDQVRAQSRAMMELRVSERQQLAREIHDDPLQAVTSFAMRANVIALHLNTAGLTPQAMDTQQMAADAQHTAKVLRRICAGLRPPVLEEGVQAVVLEAVRQFQQTRCEVEVEREIADELPTVAPQTLEAILHIITEALANIGKHAQAKQVWVQLHPQAEQLELQVLDDGQGFPQAGLSLATLARQGHFGLVGMYEWATIAQGQLQIAPREGRGTVLTLRVPVSVGEPPER